MRGCGRSRKQTGLRREAVPVIAKITGNFEITGKPGPGNRAFRRLIRDLRHASRVRASDPRKNRSCVNTMAYENSVVFSPYFRRFSATKNCTCVGSNCTCVGQDCTFAGSDCRFVGSNCHCVGQDCRFVGSNCAWPGRDCAWSRLHGAGLGLKRRAGSRALVLVGSTVAGVPSSTPGFLCPQRSARDLPRAARKPQRKGERLRQE